MKERKLKNVESPGLGVRSLDFNGSRNYCNLLKDHVHDDFSFDVDFKTDPFTQRLRQICFH